MAKRRNHATVGAFIYFIRAGTWGPIKVGIAFNPVKRMMELQVSHYLPLTLVKTIRGTKKQEGEIHLRFFDHSMRGEWFRPDQMVLDFIDNVQDYMGREPPPKPEPVEPIRFPRLRRKGTPRKLSADAVRHIRSVKETEVQLSKRFDVSRSVIGRIRRNEIWSHI